LLTDCCTKKHKLEFRIAPVTLEFN